MKKIKINKKFIISIIVIYIVVILYYIFNILSSKNNNFFYGKDTINEKVTSINITKKCKFNYLSINNVFTDYQTKKSQKQFFKKSLKNDKVYILQNKIFYRNKEFLYLGDLVKNNNKYSIFLYSGKNTKFYNLKLFDKLDDTNLTLILNNNYKLIFKYKDKNLTLKKSYINMKKFQKDINETHNSK